MEKTKVTSVMTDTATMLGQILEFWSRTVVAPGGRRPAGTFSKLAMAYVKTIVKAKVYNPDRPTSEAVIFQKQ